MDRVTSPRLRLAAAALALSLAGGCANGITAQSASGPATAPSLIKAGDAFISIHAGLASALPVLADATSWLMRHGVEDPRNALAGATPYLRMFGLVTAGWLMAKSALAAQRRLDAGEGDAEALAAKIATARFFCEQILPQVHGLADAVQAGFGPLYDDLPADAF